MYPAACFMQVVATLKELASAGHTVVCSIHQPRSSIFGMFDDLLLLSEGRCVYSGPAEEALPYFEQVCSVQKPVWFHAVQCVARSDDWHAPKLILCRVMLGIVSVWSSIGVEFCNFWLACFVWSTC
jgi:ABC-type hemin transport system ATPase subunit